ncbi:MAG: 30S ribosome-binding factor RbfA [Candidatus Margulisbacteria bacterium]|nr:30S ribosome-binding factor RbfA [Candidatus Margulisiibacteriota bacterium]MBU1021657.1 30S ribosome-binding factor RbfA [Candidatus Margulisiibacteriota bacterium]MBU1728807.1 30S ribosome-binding factor RbfA [Candidatus Margulisiibacteriota bacterium]MBU1955773.1 30S ribosome-binding factor RbfA [Candidatus Margulisiibacteriota bacterium]
MDRIIELIKQEVSSILKRKVNDPRIGFVSITDVSITPDLKYAQIYVSIMGDETAKLKSLAGLNSAKSFIRGELGHVLEFRVVPDISFVRDDSIERGSRILNLLSKIKYEGKKHDQKPKKRRKVTKKRK